MDATREDKATTRKDRTKIERRSDRELVVTRTVNGPPRLVFEAWTTPELFKRWWVPKSAGITMLACDMDIRTGGTYRLVFAAGPGQSMEFFGKYVEVTPHSRLVWTNDEGGEAGPVTTVTFEEKGGQTLLIVRELYPSKAALDASLAAGSSADAMPETLDQLEELLATLGS